MADAQVQIVVSAKDQASKVFGGIGDAAGGLAKTLAIGVAAGGAAMAAGLGVAVNAAADFEQRMSAVKAVSGATQQEMAQLSDKALQLGKDTSFSASEAAKGLEELVKGGVSIPDIMNGAAEATLNLAAAGGVDLATAAEIASNALNTFSLNGSDMAHVSDMIAGAANASAIDVNDFRLSMSAAGVATHLVGGTFDDLSVAITAMGNAGIKGSDAGTSLKTMLMNLKPETKEQIALSKQLGLVTASGSSAFFDATGKIKSFADVAGTLQTALKGQTQEQKLATLSTLFGSDAIRAAAIFAEQGAEGFQHLTDKIQGISAADVAHTRLDNLKGDLEQLSGSAETASIKFGEAFQEPLRNLTQGLTKFVNDTVIPLAEQLGPPLAAAAVSAGEQLGKIAESAKQAASEGLGALGTKLDEIGAQWAPWAAEAGPAGDSVGHALTGVHDAAEATRAFLAGDFKTGVDLGKKALDEFGAAASDAGRAVSEKLTPAARDVAAALAPVAPVLDAAAQKAKPEIFESLGRSLDNVEKAGGAITNVLGRDADLLGTVAGSAGVASEGMDRTAVATDILAGVLEAPAQDLENMTAGFATTAGAADTFTGTVVDVAHQVPTAIETVGSAFDTLGSTVQSGMATAGSAFSTVSDTIGQTVTDTWNQIPEDIRSDLELVATTVASRLGETASSVGTQMQAMTSSAGENIGNFASAVGSGLDTLRGDAESKAAEIAAAIQAPLEGLAASVGTAMSSLGTVISSSLKTTAGSASAEASGIGSAIVSGLVGGINAGINSVTAAAANLARTALAAAKNALAVGSPSQEFADIGEDVDAGLVEGINTGADDAAQAAADMADQVVAAATDALDAAAPELDFSAYNLGQSVTDALAAGLGKTKVATAVDDLKGTVAGAMRDMAADVEQIISATTDKLAAIPEKAAAAMSTAIAAASASIQGALNDANDRISELLDTRNLSRGLRAFRDAFDQAMSGADDTRSSQRDAEDQARSRAQEDAKAQAELSRDLQKAKTNDERQGLIDRFKEQQQATQASRQLEDDNAAYRRRRQDEDRAYRQQQEQKRQNFEDALSDQALQRTIDNQLKERDARIKSIQDALAEKEKKIADDAAQEQAKLVADTQKKVQTLKDEFIAKLPPLTSQAQTIVNTFLGGIDIGLLMVAHLAQDAIKAIGQIPRQVTVRVDTVQTGDDGDVGPIEAGRSYPLMDQGGIVKGPSWVQVGPGVQEAFIPLNKGTGVPSATINLSVYGTVVTPRDLVDAIHDGLLQKKRGLGTLGLA